MCDHKPLEHLGTVHKRTLLRVQELIGEYNFTIKYMLRKMQGLVDALSRGACVLCLCLSIVSWEFAKAVEQMKAGIKGSINATK